ncbi:methyltransferase domain-containing protein [bacterium]|nr:methyltransferase domain-containing protein [bacterium]
MSLKVRRRIPELMDAPDLGEREHRLALVGLKRVNAISRSDAILWPTIQQLASQSSTRPLRILDLACGGGDVLCRLAARGMRAGVSLEIHGCDRSETALAASRELVESHELSNVELFSLDVQRERIPDDYDVIMCSLFLHHLDALEVVDLLHRMSQSTRQCLLANDLRRTTFGYLAAWVGCRLLTRSHIVHVDGPRSVAGAFSCEEIRDLAMKAGLSSIRLTTHWPQRFLLRWDRP